MKADWTDKASVIRWLNRRDRIEDQRDDMIWLGFWLGLVGAISGLTSLGLWFFG